jgi:hypothetical protein
MNSEEESGEVDMKSLESQIREIKGDIRDCRTRVDGAFNLNNKVNRLMSKLREENTKKMKIIKEQKSQIKELRKRMKETAVGRLEVQKLKGTVARLLQDKRKRVPRTKKTHSQLGRIQEESQTTDINRTKPKDLVLISQVNPETPSGQISLEKPKSMKGSSSVRNIYVAPEEAGFSGRSGSLDKKKLEVPRAPLFPNSFMVPNQNIRNKSPEMKTDVSMIGRKEENSNKSFYSNFYEENTHIQNLLEDIQGSEKKGSHLNFKKKTRVVCGEDSFARVENEVKTGKGGVLRNSPRNMLVDLR